MLRAALLRAGVDDDNVIEYMTSVCSEFVADGEGDVDEWTAALEPTLGDWLADKDIEGLCRELIGQLLADKVAQLSMADKMNEEKEREKDKDPSVIVDLSKVCLQFMGADPLLISARLVLRRGHRYGLSGGNGVGKTTLLRKIAQKDLPHFPLHLRVVFVEHEIDITDINYTCVAFMEAAVQKQGLPSNTDVRPTLTQMGFDQYMQDRPVQELSGGWRMRLALAQAMLSSADILCLDEPTNHMDTQAVEFLQKFLANLGSEVTVVVISHEPAFLDAVVTDMLLMRDQILHFYEGNFSAFTQQSGFGIDDLYRSLDGQDAVELKFPEPERLANTASTKSILNLSHVDFNYPGSEKRVLADVNCKLMLISRVAVIGANGSGKSTLTKLIVGEVEPNPNPNAELGKMTRHHELRTGYVSQHSIFHLQEHLGTSAVHYLQWRFKDGLDRESTVLKKSKEIDETREKKEVSRNEWGHINELQFAGVIDRRLKKSHLEYEVTFTGKKARFNKWETIFELQKRGPYAVQCAAELDEAMRTSRAGIQKGLIMPEDAIAHLELFGISEQLATGRLIQLSGGQRARVVIAAAMWNKPHLLVLDEPTNFLDAVSLRALARAIKDFKGGVIMVSHHEDFITSLCSEVWCVKDGRVVIEERAYDKEQAAYNKALHDEDDREVEQGKL